MLSAKLIQMISDNWAQIADRVVVLGAVQAVEGGAPARIRIGQRCPIQLVLDPRGERLVGWLIGPRQAGGRQQQTESQQTIALRRGGGAWTIVEIK